MERVCRCSRRGASALTVTGPAETVVTLEPDSTDGPGASLDCAGQYGVVTAIGCGAAARLLGPTSKTVQTALTAAWNAARLALLGLPAPNLRKG